MDKASRQFRIIVADNFHYQDRDEEYEIEGADTAGEAVAKCKQLVDQSLAGVAEPGRTAETIIAHYRMFGEDPYIVSLGDERVNFSAWDYADERAVDFVRPVDPAAGGT